MAKGLIAQLVVAVTSKGAGAVRKETEQLATSTNKVGDAHAAASKSARDHFNTQDKGIIGTANSTRSFSKLAQTIDGGSSSVVGAYATLMANVFALTAAFNALKSAAAMQQIEKGLEALGTRTGQTLSIAAKGLKEITGNAISTEQALRSSAQVFSAGFGTKELERLGKVANDASFALGRNMTDSMDRLTRGVIKLEPELLDELGIMTRLGEATKAYAAELGKSESALTNAEKRQAYYNAVMEEGELKFGGLAEEAGNTKAYDKLSASMSDLTKSSINLINKGALPLAEFFANSPAAIIGGMLLFASTIKSQLLPGLANLSLKMAEVAEEKKKLVTEEINDIIKFNPDTNSANLAKLKTQIEAGTAGFNDYRAALTKTNEEIGRFEKTISKFEARGIDSNAAQFRNYKKNLEVVSQYKEEQKELQEVVAAHHAVEARVAGANAINAAGSRKYAEAVKELRASYSNYRTELILTQPQQQLTATGMTNLRAAAFGASIGVRALGAAFLSAIPIFGAIAMALGIIMTAYRGIKGALETKEQKEYNRTMKELGEILETLGKKAKEYEKIQLSTANAYLRQAQGLTLLSNISNEIADKLDEAAAAQEKSLRKVENLEKNTYASRLKMLEDFSNQVADPAARIGMKIGSTIAEWTMKKWSGISIDSDFVMFRDFDKTVTDSPGFKSYKELIEKGIPELNRSLESELAKASGGLSLKEIDRLPDKTRQAKIFFQAAREGVRVFQELAPAIEATTAAIKLADDAAGSFIKDLAISTSYDSLVKGFDAINVALIEQKRLMSSAELDAREYYKTLSGVGTNMAKFLSEENRNILSNYKEQDSIVQRLSSKEASGAITEQERKALEKAKVALTIEEGRMSAVEAQVFERQSQFRLMKAEEEQSKRLLELEKARMGALSSIYESTAEGLAAQYAAEERLAGLQAQTIVSRKKVLDIIAEGNTLTAEEQATLTALTAKRGNLTEEESKTYQNLHAKQVAISEVESGRIGANTELATLAEAQLTSAQKTAEIELRRVTALNNILSIRRQINETIAKTDITESKINALLSGRVLGVVDEAKELIANNNIRRETARIENEATKRRLAAEARVASAVSTRAGLTAEESKAVTAKLEELKTQQQLADATLKTTLDSIDAEERYERLSKAIFDTRTQGLEWQKEGLSLLEKQASITQDILNSEIQREQTLDKLSKRIRNIKITEAQDSAYELDAQRQQYKLAIEQAALRRTMIDLEFALLDGQREILRQQLIQKREELMQLGASDAHLAQINNSIRILGQVNVDSVRKAAQDALTSELELKRTNLKLLSAIDRSGGNDSISSSVAGAVALAMARSNARNAADREVDDTIRESALETSTAITEATTPIKSAAVRTVELLTTIDSNIAKMTDSAEGSSNLSLSATTAKEAIVEAGKLIQAKGFRVSEQSSFGGNTGGHRGAGHREDRAIDVNIGRGNREWDNPQQKARMDALAVELRAMGATVLWGVEGHFDHMHVEFKEGFTNQVAATRAIETAVRETPSQIAEAVENQAVDTGTPTQVDDITVTAKRKSTEPAFGWMETLDSAGTIIDGYSDKLSKLGPQGELVMGIASGAHSITSSILGIGEAMKEIDSLDLSNFQKSALKFSTVADTVGSALAAIANIASRSSEVKIEGIDKEIAAEQRRDGKSAESLAKIQSMEAKKDAIAKKAFEVNKKLQMAQAIVSTASGVAMALASAPPPFSFALAALVGAMGAAQMAIIAGTSYQSTSAPAQQAALPSTLTIGKQGDRVDLAKNNSNAGGEIGYLRGARGQGRSASDYAVIGSAYGGPLPRGYGNTGFLVGENGPEIIKPEAPVTVQPANDNSNPAPVNATFNINALDASGVQDILHAQRGFIIGSIREAANANGEHFMENINTSVYTKPNSVSRL